MAVVLLQLPPIKTVGSMRAWWRPLKRHALIVLCVSRSPRTRTVRVADREPGSEPQGQPFAAHRGGVGQRARLGVKPGHKT